MAIPLEIAKRADNKYSVIFESRTGRRYLISPVIVTGSKPLGPRDVAVVYRVSEERTKQQYRFIRTISLDSYSTVADTPADSEELAQIILVRASLQDLYHSLDSFTQPFEEWGEDNKERWGGDDLPDYLEYRDRNCEYQKVAPGCLVCLATKTGSSTATDITSCNSCKWPEVPFRCRYSFVQTLSSRSSTGFSLTSHLLCGRGQDIRGVECGLLDCFVPCVVESKRRRSAVSVPATVDEALAAMEDPHLEFKVRLSGPGKNIRKDIAAFSSCEGGAIFIGITNDGEPIGLDIEPTRGNMDKLELQLMYRTRFLGHNFATDLTQAAILS